MGYKTIAHHVMEVKDCQQWHNMGFLRKSEKNFEEISVSDLLTSALQLQDCA